MSTHALRHLALTLESAQYLAKADALEGNVEKKVDRIAQMFSCPEKGNELRRAIAESREEFFMAKQEKSELQEIVPDDEEIEDDEYDEFDWTTE